MRCSTKGILARLAGVVAFCWLVVPCRAQLPAETLAGKLTSLASRAATAFVGQVVGIKREGGTVAVSFRVDEPLIGAVPRLLLVREWSGLWAPGQVRYVVGERVLIFLHSSNAQGMTTPVDGGEGVVPVLVQGAGVTPLLDIRRLGASILRPIGSPLPDAANGAVTLVEAVALVRAAMVSSADLRLGPTLRQRPLPERGVRLHSAPMLPVGLGGTLRGQAPFGRGHAPTLPAEVPLGQR